MLPDPDITSALAQLGVAGLIGWLWLSERRSAAARDLQLHQAHERLEQERTHTGALLQALERNTKALTALEHGQQRLISLLDAALLSGRSTPHPMRANRSSQAGVPSPGRDHPAA